MAMNTRANKKERVPVEHYRTHATRPNMFSADSITNLTDIVNRWQHKLPVTGHEMRLFGDMVDNVSSNRWRQHFGGVRKDWIGSVNIRENVSLAFMDYLVTRRSVRTITSANTFICSIDTEPVYPTLKYTMTEFRMQFPRIVSTLIARECGVKLLLPWQEESFNICHTVRTIEHSELHLALCILRQLAAESDTLLYQVHSPELLDMCYHRLICKVKGKHGNPPAFISLRDRLQADDVPRTVIRRASAVLAASDILVMRSVNNLSNFKQGNPLWLHSN